ncbi:kinase-like domain-containing protein [Rhizophagus irregularis DAOM 181602=DAOM 197198]|uniref:Mkk2p n=3 Tax=Rhizophagus irregularis TaxID=588596 RepID=A0A015KFL5_RHIIW|nr:kinase-like domain-containing protein [Rhizophagus irregularis DAOM 181602=DAOM 197198]EXX58411.1 Mkk2p [Rhizophagus irregularis DAOM 197198w]POG74923.1 kinase-like domain-containing protein [Rhizophagus irregularis DAOM 181602=DAOM 197198]|eukprot:XP_025181789.1 kinase-like domain-containing protein [Rhizophagus irregularis DAOM 181602=DAOM 197198]
MWIPYDKFKNIKYLDKGGFGTIYEAIWSDKNMKVVLKCLNNLNDSENFNEFLDEWKNHYKCIGSKIIVHLYGFTKNPKTSNYTVVMDYADKGNLRKCLTNIITNDWRSKLHKLFMIIAGLHKMHEQNLIHCDFHDGNILINKDEIWISDLGLSRPVKSFFKDDEIYGVMPFIAPEILRGKPYTPASDIYSFSMIMWEFTSGISPFNDRAYDVQLSISICEGERPEIIENTPQCYIDLMKKCWDGDLLKRPSTSEVLNVIKRWIYLPSEMEIKNISEELKSNIMEFINAPIGYIKPTMTESHPQAYHTSRLFNFTSKKLNEILESECSDFTNEKSNKILKSESLDDCIV